MVYNLQAYVHITIGVVSFITEVIKNTLYCLKLNHKKLKTFT